jgi:hypothetical protein
MYPLKFIRWCDSPPEHLPIPRFAELAHTPPYTRSINDNGTMSHSEPQALPRYNIRRENHKVHLVLHDLTMHTPPLCGQSKGCLSVTPHLEPAK